MNGVQTRFKCKLDVKRCKRFVFPPSSLLPRSNALKTKAIRYFQTDRTLTRIVSPPLIVGHGGDYELCENIIKNEDIPAVTLEGRQDPIPYYKEASIFMMTSRSEAWGLTLTEAQQMGVVPIAFDTYASLRDIITDGVDGEIIAEGDVDGYVRCVLNLMQDDVTRQRMARQAIASSQRFSQEKIAGMWKALFDNLG